MIGVADQAPATALRGVRSDCKLHRLHWLWGGVKWGQQGVAISTLLQGACTGLLYLPRYLPR